MRFSVFKKAKGVKELPTSASFKIERIIYYLFTWISISTERVSRKSSRFLGDDFIGRNNMTGMKMWPLSMTDLCLSSLEILFFFFLTNAPWSGFTNITPWHEEEGESFPSALTTKADFDCAERRCGHFFCQLSIGCIFASLRLNHIIHKHGSHFYSNRSVNELDFIVFIIYKVGCCYRNHEFWPRLPSLHHHSRRCLRKDTFIPNSCEV